MTIQIVTGNILNAKEHIIAHQVNGLGVMGAGLAKQIKKKYPSVYKSYKKFVKQYSSPESLLGINYMVTDKGLPVGEFDRFDPNAKIIANLFGQARIGKTKQTDEQALKAALISLKKFAETANLEVALPFGIGSGLGGADWNEVLKIIEEVFDNYPVTIYKLEIEAFNGVK